MKTETYFKTAGSTAAAGVGMAGLALALTGPLMTTATVATACLAGTAVVATALGTRQWQRRRVPGTQLGQLGAYSSRWAAGDADVAEAYELFVSQLQDDDEQVSLDLLREIHALNHQTIRLIERHRESESRLMGMVALVPITRDAEVRIRDGRMRDSYDAFLASDVATGWHVQAAYIGGIAGSTDRARGYALGFCESWLREHAISSAYARPISRDGERVMRRWGFHPIPAPSRIWRWDLDESPPVSHNRDSPPQHQDHPRFS